ncbi:MAG: hypothetical protein JWO59_1104 [Chloroflexi bacterium]|nr:hypothetical protein [Chloroflexota bacterium]
MVKLRVAALSRLLGAVHWTVIRNASSLVGTTLVNLSLGAVYWWLAARWFAPSALGLASAAISAMALLGALGMFGLGTLLIGELQRRPDLRGELVATGLLTAGLAGCVFGAIFAVFAPSITTDLQPLASSTWSIGLFALGVGLTALTLVLDQALIGLFRGSLQLWRNALFGLAKLAALAATGIWWADRHASTIMATWVAGLVACLAALTLMTGGIKGHYRPRPELLYGLGWQAIGHHVLNVALQVSGLAMPLVVTVLLSTAANAYYYTAGMVAGLVYIAPTSLAIVLFAVGTAEPAALAQRVRFTLGLSLAVTLLANGVLLMAASPILSVFGRTYAENGAVPLQLLALGALPIIIREHYAAIQRIHGRPVGAAPLVLAGSALKLILAAKGASLGGLVGLSMGLLIAGCIEALLMAPLVYRAAVGTGAAREKPPAHAVPNVVMSARSNDEL